MLRYLAEARYHKAFQESLCLPGGNRSEKSREIHLCIDYHKLNSISLQDSFPLPRIDEALQAMQSANWFMSFDLVQGYLRLAMEEVDIPKTAFRAGSSGLYEFTCMPFSLSNSGASFCRLMEMCLGDR